MQHLSPESSAQYFHVRPVRARVAFMYSVVKSCICTIWQPELHQDMSYLSPTSSASIKICRIPWKCRNSAKIGTFCGLAHYFAHGKLVPSYEWPAKLNGWKSKGGMCAVLRSWWRQWPGGLGPRGIWGQLFPKFALCPPKSNRHHFNTYCVTRCLVSQGAVCSLSPPKKYVICHPKFPCPPKFCLAMWLV